MHKLGKEVYRTEFTPTTNRRFFCSTCQLSRIESDAFSHTKICSTKTDSCFYFRYETGNGIQAQETGRLNNPGVEGQEAQEAEGSYSYTAPDGTLISVTYVANENGFVPKGKPKYFYLFLNSPEKQYFNFYLVTFKFMRFPLSPHQIYLILK